MASDGFHNVRFVDVDDSPGVIASNWLTGDGRCFYPPVIANKMLDKLIRAKADPKPESWGIHEIRIIGNYDTYDAARHALPISEFTSDLEQVEGEKKNTKRNFVFIKEEIEEEMQSTQHTPSKRRSPVSKNKMQPSFNTPHLPAKQNTLTFPCDLSPLPYPASQPCSSKQMLNNSKKRHSSQTITDTLDSFNTNAPNTDMFDATTLKNKLEVIEDKFETIVQCFGNFRHLIENLTNKVDVLDSKVNELLTRKGHLHEEDQEIDLNELLPIATVASFQDLEESLANDPSLVKQMVKYLSLSGGKDLQKSSNAIMSRLMLDEVAQGYNLTGKSTKAFIKNAFVGTKLWQVVLYSCQKSYKEATVENVRECVGNWFHQAKTRIVRRVPRVEENNLFDDADLFS